MDNLHDNLLSRLFFNFAAQWHYPPYRQKPVSRLIEELMGEEFDRSESNSASVHRIGESPDGFLSATAGRTVGDDRDLLNAGLLDSFDLPATFVYRSGDGEFID